MHSKTLNSGVVKQKRKEMYFSNNFGMLGRVLDEPLLSLLEQLGAFETFTQCEYSLFYSRIIVDNIANIQTNSSRIVANNVAEKNTECC